MSLQIWYFGKFVQIFEYIFSQINLFFGGHEEVLEPLDLEEGFGETHIESGQK